ncbi:MAG: antitoxin [Deltaproteobacteria bacterium]|nr:MAG: antitoxin [Deltaproteobacteria bacterium]
MKKNKEYRDRIVIDSDIHFGKPCVAGTRVPVENVLELIQEGIAFEEIVRNYYPDLEIEDVKACARYATDIVKHEEVHIGAV